MYTWIFSIIPVAVFWLAAFITYPFWGRVYGHILAVLS